VFKLKAYETDNVVFKHPVALMYSPETITSVHSARSIYTEEQHHYTGRVKGIQARGIHDNYINVSRLHTHKHPCRCASNPSKENPHNGVWIKR
jgi:hypothetical protein